MKDDMARMAPLRRDETKDFETLFEVTEAVMGFVPNSMLIMARDPDLLAAFTQLSTIVVVRPGRIDPGLKALVMYAVSRSAGCQYPAAWQTAFRNPLTTLMRRDSPIQPRTCGGAKIAIGGHPTQQECAD